MTRRTRRKIRRVRFPALVTLLGLGAAAASPLGAAQSTASGTAIHPVTAAESGAGESASAAASDTASDTSSDTASSFQTASFDATPSMMHRAWAAPEPPPAMSVGPSNPVPVSVTLSGDEAELSEEILLDPNVVLSGRDVFADIYDTAAGGVGTSGAPISTALLRLILAVSEKHTIAISSIEGGGTGHCPDGDGGYEPKSVCPQDPHYNGDAIDFFALDGNLLWGRDPGSLTIIETAIDVLPDGSGFGQSNCGTTPPLPAGWVTLPDECSHLHVQVPIGSP